jgi:hypothetical protein
MRTPICSAASGLLTLALCSATAGATEELRFQVYLDERRIGEHRFEIERSGGRERVASRAAFEIDFLFFTAYRYRHTSTEAFRNGCLERLVARTDDNGTGYRIAGELVGDTFRIDRGSSEIRAAGCLKSFAYWDPAILEQDRLLNPQTGEIEPVQVSRRGEERVEVNDREVPATRYALATDELTIDLWYNDALGWVGLAGDTGKGVRIVYRRL